MATITFRVTDAWLAEFHAKFSPDERENALTDAFLGLLQSDPYSEAALAEDERRYEEGVRTNSFIPHEKVMAHLQAQLDDALGIADRRAAAKS